jgi:hypothetical protein
MEIMETKLKHKWLILDEKKRFKDELDEIREKAIEAKNYGQLELYKEWVAYGIKIKKNQEKCLKALNNISEHCINMLYEERSSE